MSKQEVSYVLVLLHIFDIHIRRLYILGELLLTKICAHLLTNWLVIVPWLLHLSLDKVQSSRNALTIPQSCNLPEKCEYPKQTNWLVIFA